ncbi:MAG: hypothetical protein WKF92_15750 [Pyrinomonadaceae bacterium]
MPNQKLVNEIIESLTAEKLIPENRSELIRGKILAGTASVDDWRNWIDTAQLEMAKDEEVKKNA